MPLLLVGVTGTQSLFFLPWGFGIYAEVAQAPLGTVNMTLCNSIFIRVKGLGTINFTNLIGWNRYWKRSRFSHLDRFFHSSPRIHWTSGLISKWYSAVKLESWPQSVLTNSVKILPFRPPAQLIRWWHKIVQNKGENDKINLPVLLFV